MKTRLAVLFSVLALLFLPIASLAADQSNNDAQNTQYLIVMPVLSGSYDGKKLTVKAAPQVIYFSDHPEHTAGHLRTSDFIKNWDYNIDPKLGPINATLSIFTDDDSVNNVVIEISNPKYANGEVVFTVKVLEGDLPASFDEASMFMDNFRVVGGR